MTQVKKGENVESKEATVVVSRTYLGQTKTKEKKIRIRPFVTDTANVSVKFGTTIPLGDFQSARVDVMISCQIGRAHV